MSLINPPGAVDHVTVNLHLLTSVSTYGKVFNVDHDPVRTDVILMTDANVQKTFRKDLKI